MTLSLALLAVAGRSPEAERLQPPPGRGWRTDVPSRRLWWHKAGAPGGSWEAAAPNWPNTGPCWEGQGPPPARPREGRAGQRGFAAGGGRRLRAGPERKGLPLVCSLSRSSPSGPLCRRVSGEDLLDADRALALGLHHVLRQVSTGQSPRYALAHEANGKLQVTETTQTGLGPQWNQPECRNRQQESLRKNGRSLKGNKKCIELN